VRAMWVILVLAGCLLCSCSEESKELFSVELADPLSGGIDLSLVSISGGTFQMGSYLNPAFEVVVDIGGVDTVYNRERPVHRVTLDGFKISTREITQAQFMAVMGYNPSKFLGSPNLPVEQVSWKDAVRFCNKLSEMTGLEPCYNLQSWECDFSRNGFRLPTEAEWEYACRAGSELEFFSGSSTSDLARVAWFVANSAGTTHEVGLKIPNTAGLYDTHGNVWEWCNDWYGSYHCNSEINPRGPERGYWRVLRGGSWASSASECRSAFRRAGHPEQGNSTTGFRVVRR